MRHVPIFAAFSRYCQVTTEDPQFLIFNLSVNLCPPLYKMLPLQKGWRYFNKYNLSKKVYQNMSDNILINIKFKKILCYAKDFFAPYPNFKCKIHGWFQAGEVCKVIAWKSSHAVVIYTKLKWSIVRTGQKTRSHGEVELCTKVVTDLKFHF